MKLDAEWKHEVAHCTDQSKRALYVMFLGGDCPEVTDSIEAWLWLKLMCCKLDVANGRSQFHKLQTTVCVDCGEDYFVSGSGNFLLYFSALWMTGRKLQWIVFIEIQAKLSVQFKSCTRLVSRIMRCILRCSPTRRSCFCLHQQSRTPFVS